jgi:hypothetical protein
VLPFRQLYKDVCSEQVGYKCTTRHILNSLQLLLKAFAFRTWVKSREYAHELLLWRGPLPDASRCSFEERGKRVLGSVGMCVKSVGKVGEVTSSCVPFPKEKIFSKKEMTRGQKYCSES